VWVWVVRPVLLLYDLLPLLHERLHSAVHRVPASDDEPVHYLRVCFKASRFKFLQTSTYSQKQVLGALTKALR